MPQGAAARELQRRQTRGRLVESARKLFAETGFERATIDDVAADAGYSKGAYYFHFDTKEEMLEELLDQWKAERSERLDRAIGGEQPAGAALLDALEALLSYEGAASRWKPLLIEFWAQALRNRALRHSLDEAYKRWASLLEGAFGRARDEGVLRSDLDPAVAAALALALHDGLAAQSAVNAGSKIPLHKMIAACLSPMLPHGDGGRKAA